MRLPVSAIVLTYNDENIIEDCLKSAYGFVEDIFVVDSFSSDKTLEIVKKYTDKIYQHEFENYGRQRNWALKSLPFKTEWVLNLDSDHRITDLLKNEMSGIFSKNKHLNTDGFLITRKTIFMGKWIKHGASYPVYQPVLFKLGAGYCEEARYNQHLVVNGSVKKMSGDIEDVVTCSLSVFIQRHNRWSTDDAIDQILKEDQVNARYGAEQNLFGNPMEKRRYFRGLYMKLPLLVRPFVYFFYRYFIRFGFLDGLEGLIFHTLQGFWYQFLVDAKMYEIKKEPDKYKSHEKTKQKTVSVRDQVS